MSEYENPIVKRRSRDVWQAEVRVAPGGNGGPPHPLQGAALLHEFPQEFFYPPGVPAPLLRAAMAPLALAARLRGLRGSYPRYTERKVAA